MNDGATGVVIEEALSKNTAEQVAENSCVLEIHKHEPGFSKRVDSKALFDALTMSSEDPSQPNIDPDWLNVSKTLIDRKELKELRSHTRAFFAWIKWTSLPGGILTLGGGQFLMPLSRVQEVKQRIDKYVSERDGLLDAFEQKYPAVIERAKERLGSQFDATDYPEFSVIRSAYDTSYKFISNKVPEELKKVSDELYNAEKARITAECAGLVPLIQENLRARFVELVEHFKDRLATDDSTGKKKRFHGSNIDKLKEFIGTFAQMNLTGDGDLAVLVEQSKALVDGADVDKIRTDDAFREQLASSFNEVKVAADKLVTERKRRVVLED